MYLQSIFLFVWFASLWICFYGHRKTSHLSLEFRFAWFSGKGFAAYVKTLALLPYPTLAFFSFPGSFLPTGNPTLYFSFSPSLKLLPVATCYSPPHPQLPSYLRNKWHFSCSRWNVGPCWEQRRQRGHSIESGKCLLSRISHLGYPLWFSHYLTLLWENDYAQALFKRHCGCITDLKSF